MCVLSFSKPAAKLHTGLRRPQGASCRYYKGPLTPALSPSAGERENHPQPEGGLSLSLSHRMGEGRGEGPRVFKAVVPASCARGPILADGTLRQDEGHQ